jgi:hypothetical protein
MYYHLRHKYDERICEISPHPITLTITITITVTHLIGPLSREWMHGVRGIAHKDYPSPFAGPGGQGRAVKYLARKDIRFGTSVDRCY